MLVARRPSPRRCMSGSSNSSRAYVDEAISHGTPAASSTCEPVPGVLAGEDRASSAASASSAARRAAASAKRASVARSPASSASHSAAHCASSVTNTHSQPSAVSYSRCSAEKPYCSASMRSRSGPLPSGRANVVAVEQHADVEDRRVHELPLAGAVAVAQRLDHRGRRDDAVAGVAVRRHLPDRRRAVVRAAGLVGGAGEGVAHLVVARQRRARPVALEAAGVAVDDRRVDRPGLLVADAEPLGDAGAHVVVDDVGPLDQPPGDLLPRGCLRSRASACLPWLEPT